MQIDAKTVMKLRKMTGAGVVDCKNALIETNGDIEKAVDLLRASQGKKLAKLAKKSSSEGVVGHYVHHDNKQAAMVELRCATDFVALNADFQEFAKQLAIHVVAVQPEALGLDRSDIPAELVERERGVYTEQVKDKPAEIQGKIVEGKIASFYKERVLLDQIFAMDNDGKSIRTVLDEMSAKVGEPVRIARFVKFVVGAADANE